MAASASCVAHTYSIVKRQRGVTAVAQRVMPIISHLARKRISHHHFRVTHNLSTWAQSRLF